MNHGDEWVVESGSEVHCTEFTFVNKSDKTYKIVEIEEVKDND